VPVSQQWIVPVEAEAGAVAFSSYREGNNLYSVSEIVSKYFTLAELFIPHCEPSGK